MNDSYCGAFNAVLMLAEFLQVRQRDHEICRLTSMMAPTANEAQHSIENLRAAIATLEEANKDLRSQLQGGWGRI